MIKSQMKNSKSLNFLLLAIGLGFFSISCSSDSGNEGNNSTSSSSSNNTATARAEVPKHGVGPVEEVDLGEGIDQEMAARGEEIFEAKCSACHKMDERYVGPALSGVTERRDPAWIMNMIMNPEEMTKKDPVAKALLAEYMTQMVYQDVSREETRAILEFFRQNDNQN